MIVASVHHHEVGERNFGIYDKDGVWHNDQPFLITRVATCEEYIAYAAEQNAVNTPLSVAGAVAFYELSVD